MKNTTFYLCFHIVLSLLCVSLGFRPLGASPKLGIYTTEKLPLTHGYLVLAMEFYKEKNGLSFRAQELRFHREKGYEEVLVEGAWTPHSQTTTELRAGQCQVRATKEWGQKMGLLRKFDCDHLLWLWNSAADLPTLSETLLGTLQTVSFPIFVPTAAGEPVAFRFGGAEIWGFHLNGLKGRDPYQTWDRAKGKFVPFLGYEDKEQIQVYRWLRPF